MATTYPPQGSLGPAGHLLTGNAIRTTAEIALLLPDAVRFERPIDPATGHRELAFEAAA